MNSRFKFVKSVDPQTIQTNTTKSRFGKLTLATTKSVAVESINNEMKTVRRITQTVTHTTTVSETVDEQKEKPIEAIPSEQKPKILLYESTILHGSMIDKDLNESDLLTDDDTDSVGSSISSSELEEEMKYTSPPTQTSKVELINTQMKDLSVISDGIHEAKNDRNDLMNLSHQLEYLDLSLENKNENEKEEEKGKKIEQKKNLSQYSIQSLSSTDTTEHDNIIPKNPRQNDESNEIIILTDSETDEDKDKIDDKRKISSEPPFKPIAQSDNDGAAFNVSSNYSNEICKLNSAVMQKVNQFFDNIPYTEVQESSFNTTLMSKSLKDPVYVSESSEEESIVETSTKSSNNNQNEERTVAEINTDEQASAHNHLEFSGNNIVFDIPVVKSSSDQPHQLIRSQSGVRLTATNSSPIIKTSAFSGHPEFVKRSSSNVVLKKTGSSITVNSNNGQVNISAKININIHIASPEDSSSDASSEDKERPPSALNTVQSHKKEEPKNQNIERFKQNTEKNHLASPQSRTPQSANAFSAHENKLTPRPIEKIDECNEGMYSNLVKTPPQTKSKSITEAEENRRNNTPRSQKRDCTSKTPKRRKNDASNTPKLLLNGRQESSPKTPSNKLKQFEYVPPRSLTKTATKNQEPQTSNSVKRNEDKLVLPDDHTNATDGFKVDVCIPVSPRDQKLLHELYGNAWKTPDVIKSYSAIKGKPNKSPKQANVNQTPSSLKSSRFSKGFSLFKQNISENLNSTRLENHIDGEISVIEPPQPIKSIKTSEKVVKSVSKTPGSHRAHGSSTKKVLQSSPSQSVLNKLKPLENDSSAIQRPKRNAVRKRILYPFDEDDEKENSTQSRKSDEPEWTKSDSESSYPLTEDDSDSDSNFTPKPSNTPRKPNSISKKSAAKKGKNKLIYLDLSSEEVVEVNENHHSDVTEDDLANITRRFLEADLNDEETKPKKKQGRKLFTPQYDDIEEVAGIEEDNIRKKLPQRTETVFDIEIPRFTQQTKLFDSKRFGSPSVNKTSDYLTPRKDSKPSNTPKTLNKKNIYSASKSKLDSPPRTFITYGFLKSLDVCASMLLCDPEAKQFRENFKSNKEELTRILYKMFNDQVFDGKLDLDIVWNKKLITTAGRFLGKTKGKSYIDLSEKVLTSADRLRCTLIHEMCHAATWIFNKQKGHGATWKSWAKRANTVFPELPPITVCHNYDIEYKYTYKCDMCHIKSYSHSKSRKVENIRCSYCHGMISIYLNKKRDGAIVMEPVRQATGFSKFVKEFYKVYKKSNVTHVDVMRTLSAEYSKLSEEEKKKY